MTHLSAAFAVVDDIGLGQDEKMILVKDVLSTMQKLGLFHKMKLGIRVIGITGTNGKTTNKELLTRFLRKKYDCYSTKGNLNNQIDAIFVGADMHPAQTVRDTLTAHVEIRKCRLQKSDCVVKVANVQVGVFHSNCHHVLLFA